MNSKLHPVTFELPNELMAELAITAHAKGVTLEEAAPKPVPKTSENEAP